MDLTGMLQAAAGAAGGENLYIEDVFSTYLYTGTGAAQTITNGIDLDGEGGLVWIKSRSAATSNFLFDTERGVTDEINSDSTGAEASLANSLTAFNSNGFSVSSATGIGVNNATYVSWTFRQAEKFFDVVTYTGNGANRTISHNLGSVPGCIMVKRTDTTGDWQVYHRANTANPETDYLVLNTTAATADSNTRWNDTQPTSTVFSLGTEATVNASGGTYVAYLWAHDAGGFGDDGLQNVVTCGSFTTDGSGNATVTLGYEPQWLLTKRTNISSNWILQDVMRGGFDMSVAGGDGTNIRVLFANTSAAEATDGATFNNPTANGFQFSFGATSATFIYIAIRRGPMKTPTAGTEVFAMDIGDGSSVPAFNGGFPIDMALYRSPTNTDNNDIGSRLTGTNKCKTNLTDAETADGDWDWDYQNGWYGVVQSSDFQSWMFRRAPKFMDVVCYTGTGSATTFAHNLGVVPELMLVKRRSAINAWAVYAGDNTDFLVLNTTAATADDNTYWNDTSPTSAVFSVGTNNATNASASTYIAYLFASLAGVQDIGSYTGNGTSVTVTTGFQPRFILVKRTDSTGNWIYGDSVRGLVAGNDPALFLNSTAAETTGQDWVDVSATGFTVNETALNANVSTATYIYLAIS
jgi:hypothetical protein